MTTLRTGALSAVLTITAVFTLPARGATYSDVVVFGDSLSDNGNLYGLDGHTIPAPPYYQGRFSNGPVAVEQLASLLGAPLIDYAFGGATSGVGNSADGGTQTSLGLAHLPGMLAELAAATVTPTEAASSLFVVWGGANDFEINGSPVVAAEDIATIVNSLEAEGATHILVPGLPDLGLTPEFYNLAAATAFSVQFNQTLQSLLPANATYFDTFATLDAIVTNSITYGFTNTTTGCYPGDFTTPGLTPCTNPSQHVFWDDIHPTTTADSILASQFAAAVTPAATPEPSSILMMGTGMLGVAGLLRLKAKL